MLEKKWKQAILLVTEPCPELKDSPLAPALHAAT